MNYRHAFHAGNFADLVKHAALTAVLRAMTARPGPVTVFDTHAGAGAYDLGGDMARRSGEAAAGIGRLMADGGAPGVFGPLKDQVRGCNPNGSLRVYPGSPLVALGVLRPGDRFIGCELRPDDHALLQQAVAERAGGRPRIETRLADGYDAASSLAPSGGRLLVLIDPPYERGDEYHRVVETVEAVLAHQAQATIIVWAPLKDLDTFDRLVTALEDLAPPAMLVVEARLRPLDDPLKMNGCALLILRPPEGVAEALASAAAWIVDRLGQPGGEARVWETAG